MSEIAHPLKSVAVHILEDWGLMLVDEQPPSLSNFQTSETFYMSWVNLHGVMEGALSILAQKDFVSTLAVNLLGADNADEITEEEMFDAFKEMGNVLAGNYLTEAYGSDVVFELLHPQVSEVPLSEAEKFMARKIVYSFSCEGNPVAVTYSIKEK